MESIDRLAIHTMTTKPWDLPTACANFADNGVRGVGVWRQWLDGRPLAESKTILDDHGCAAVSLVRGGFFPAATVGDRHAAIDDNLRAIDEAAAIGAPQVVLVCGAIPGQSLTASRDQIRDGIAACLDHAAAANVQLAIEPLHPMYADCRSAVNTIGQANDLIDDLGEYHLGIAVDVYHVWWDPNLETEIARAGDRIIGFHVCDWLTPTADMLNDRGLMGEGCIDNRRIRRLVEAASFNAWIEVEVFSTRWWSHDQADYLSQIIAAYKDHV